MITAYDATFARLAEAAMVDSILVGDSMGMVVQGHSSTLPVTLDDIIYHAKLVRRGAPDTFMIADMPFGSFQGGVNDGVKNAIRLLKESFADAVKLEGSDPDTLEIVRRLSRAGVPVVGHTRLTPQSHMITGGFRVQGKEDATRAAILKSATDLEGAGCFAIVIELVVSDLAKEISSSLSIPTIGIGAGPEADGQVLVMQDLLGMDPGFHPRHVKQYTNLAEQIQQAIQSYDREVKEGIFPGPENTFR